ncbi:ubiquinol-cytochrome c reductase complex assembly factor 2-like [Halictus rubicundus]|uniref:ubiquinol-cytochrome c reductase complex assembly factor 2-like n=1 Tax=Halictus rubicundus TaxID=77578 RepID=UPI0040370E55
MAGTYRNYMRLLESWPLDKSKAGRDLGQHIRDQLKVAFSQGEATTEVNREVCDRYYLSLKRIASNQHGEQYARARNNSASGLTKEQCNLALSPELREFFETEDKGIFVHVAAKAAQIFDNSRAKLYNVIKSNT